MEKTVKASDADIRVWGIHTQNDKLFLDGNIIAIGWDELGDLSLIPNDRESFKEEYAGISKVEIGQASIEYAIILIMIIIILMY